MIQPSKHIVISGQTAKHVVFLFCYQDNGTQITASLVIDILNAEAQKVVATSPGITVGDVEIAKAYMISEVTAKVPSDFLTRLAFPLHLLADP